ncbi:hypothetical protein ES705_00950 [subsurface metagenome]
MRLFYCAFESIFDPVFESQVLVFLKSINNKLNPDGKAVNLVIFGSIGDLFKKNYIYRRKYIKNFLDRKCFFAFKFPYFYRFPILFKCSLLINTLICFLTLCLVVRLKKSEPALFHCRTEMGSYFLLILRRIFFKNIKIICDCRGIGSKEMLYKSKNKSSNISFKRIEKIESFSQQNSDYLFCISKAFKNYIQSKTNRTNRIKVVPCCLDTGQFKYDSNVRDAIRNDFGVRNKFVLLYAGSLNGWQLPVEMVKIFKIFSTVIKDSFFIMFTNDVKYARELFSNFGLKKDTYIIRSVPHYLINRYLPVGDLGLLIRQDNDVNRVAFPLKFFEYIRCGVPILSSITSDLSVLIKKYNLGFRLKDYNNESEIRKIALLIKSKLDYLKSDMYKKKLSTIIEKEMSWDNYLDSIINIYGEI